jgi:cytochrome P450
MEISGRENVLVALTSPDLAVTPAAPAGPTGALTLAWLRSRVARFSRGPEHATRRRYAQAVIDRVAPASVRSTSRRLAEQELARVRGSEANPVDAVAHLVPVRALAELLGYPDVAVGDVAAVARVYLTGGDDAAEILAADGAVARLVAAVRAGDGDGDEGAAIIGVLVQSYQATATLILNACAAPLDAQPHDVVAATLLNDPPARLTRREATVDTRVGDVHIGVGETVVIAIGGAGLAFGAGPHACPGSGLARAIAEGVLDAVSAR